MLRPCECQRRRPIHCGRGMQIGAVAQKGTSTLSIDYVEVMQWCAPEAARLEPGGDLAVAQVNRL